MDMYATPFQDDPLDPKRGDLYRQKILGPGGGRDELKSLEVRLTIATCIKSILNRTNAGLPWSPSKLGSVHRGVVWQASGAKHKQDLAQHIPGT